MQGIKASNLLSPFSGSKHLLCIFILLSAQAAIPMFGQVSVITLAMVSYDQLPAQTTSAVRDDSAASPLANATVPLLQYQIAGLSLMHQNTLGLSSNSLFEKNDGSNPCGRSQFVNKKSNADSQTLSWMHVEAGYGQFCQYGYCFGSNAVELELRQPRCAYLRASFSF
jgi:hypothetical protein